MKQEYNFGKGKNKLNHFLFMDGASQLDIDSFIQTVYKLYTCIPSY